ncbi:flagellar biosynthesis anti-sigma factor FlgM [Halonatronum saccharophilum]|uniref:flagellar biosynthesis anti-sigma factor FlgM n=1 Tax=Halonatronum saccharophilum TaxID=150060 RepID=UPI0004875D33|nr:flagellar biosynthesis anti-sigma factor FlgM [Halonatronum saccharophilum]
MKIDGIGRPRAIKNYINNANNNSKAEKKGKKDRVSLSEQALLIQKAKEFASEPSEERQEIITSLKGQLKAGDYNVDGEDIANSILDNIFSNNLD